VCRLPASAPIPKWFVPGVLAGLTYTGAELSIVAPEETVPTDVVAERGWRAISVEGPLDFGLTGVLASLAGPLAEAGVSIFAVSTYDTDYVLVPADRLDDARRALAGDFEWVSAPERRVASGKMNSPSMTRSGWRRGVS
jgi:hypothetical protein